MKVLIIDDMEYKTNEVLQVLKSLNIVEFDTAKSITEAYLKVYKGKYDLIISDLGLPRHPNTEAGISDSLAGLEMLTIFAYRGINIPTIVYSSTEIPTEDIEYLEKLEYPYIGQAKDIVSLKNILSEYLNNLVNQKVKNSR